jgi:hypothetical protein
MVQETLPCTQDYGDLLLSPRMKTTDFVLLDPFDFFAEDCTV